MDDKTIKEICDVVTEEVMNQVRKNLSAMKPDIKEDNIMDDKTKKEICDVVTAEVMKQIQAILATMKPQIIEEIQNSVVKNAVRETARIIDKRANKFEKATDLRFDKDEIRISLLENYYKAEKSNYQLSVPALEKRIAQLELKVTKL